MFLLLSSSGPAAAKTDGKEFRHKKTAGQTRKLKVDKSSFGHVLRTGGELIEQQLSDSSIRRAPGESGESLENSWPLQACTRQLNFVLALAVQKMSIGATTGT